MKIDILVKKGETAPMIKAVAEKAMKDLKVTGQVIETTNFASYTSISVNPSQTPIVIIDGRVEFAGNKSIPYDQFKKRIGDILFRKNDGDL